MQLPRNVRQVGNPDSKSRVYIEDYVYTFLNKMKEQAKAEAKIILLLGTKEQEEDNQYYFISEALLKEDEWEKDGAHYFPDLSMLGWACTEEEG